MGRPGLVRHPKFRRLAHVLDQVVPGYGEALARGYLEAIWETAYENGDELLGDATTVEAIVRWRGTPGQLAEALAGAGGAGRAGFIEERAAGVYQVHDLWDHCPDYVAGRREKEKERQKAKLCKQCGTTYHSPDSRALYCSARCKTQAWRSGRSVTDALRTDTEPSVTVTDGYRSPAPAPAPAPAPISKLASQPAPNSEKPEDPRAGGPLLRDYRAKLEASLAREFRVGKPDPDDPEKIPRIRSGLEAALATVGVDRAVALSREAWMAAPVGERPKSLHWFLRHMEAAVSGPPRRSTKDPAVAAYDAICRRTPEEEAYDKRFLEAKRKLEAEEQKA